MKAKSVLLFLSVVWGLIIVNAMSFVCYASDDIGISQAYVNENRIDVFSQTVFDKDSLEIKVSNQQATVLDCGKLSEKDITVYTTILIDTSTSMPLETRDKVVEFVGFLIDKIASNEQYKIVTFGEQISVLQDFTSDRYDLSNSMEQLEFTAKKTMIYDAIYNTMPQIQLTDDKPCFYRTIVISDGVDVASSGITKEELFLKLQAETYPVDVVAVSKAKPEEEKKDLAALTRISSGRYVDLYPEEENIILANKLNMGDIFWLRAEIPSSLLDGSIRQVNITDGANSIPFDIKCSIYDDPNETDSTEPEAVEDNQPDEEEEAVLPEVQNVEQPSESTGFNPLIIAVICVAAIAVIVIIVVLLLVKSRKNSKKVASETVFIPNKPPIQYDDGDKTELFIGTNAVENQFMIKLSRVRDASSSWTLPVINEIIIGRSDRCAIRLDDKSVSREQCKIVVNGLRLSVINLSQTNRTLLNSSTVAGEAQLNSGDILKFGREALRIDYIQSLGKSPMNTGRELSEEKSDTESIF